MRRAETSTASTQSEGALAVDGLRVDHGSLTVLTDCSLQLRAGEVVGLFGHNGAGKTTLVRTICGLHRHRGGTIMIGGRDIGHDTVGARAAAGIALVLDGGRGVFPNLTVAENLAVAMASLRHRDAEHLERVLSLFPAVLRGRRRTAAGQLSGGQRQMVALAVALARRPQVLLLDEPSLGLAPKIVEELMEGVAGVARDLGSAVLIVEQDIPATLAVADRIMIMKGGRITLDRVSADLPPTTELWSYF